MHPRAARRDDLASLVALSNSCDTVLRGAPDTDESDICGVWDEPGFDMSRRTRVLEQDGGIVGYGWCDAGGYADTALALPDRVGAHDLLLAWLESLGTPLRHFWPAGDAPGSARFAARGWLPTRTSWRMWRDLDAELPDPVYSQGVTVREMSAASDGVAVHALVQAAFADVGDDSPPEDYDQWAARMLGAAVFEPRLCLVAHCAGTLAGACLAQPTSDFGFVRQLAVAGPLRGRGIGLALLHESFRRHRAYGLPATALGVDAGNATGATRLYERAGMRVVEQFTRWEYGAASLA